MKSATIPSCDEICAPVKLEIRDVGSPELLAGPCLIPLVCSLAIWLQTNEWILSTSRLKHLFAIDSFGLRPLPFTPVALLLYELSFSYGSSGALRVIAKYHSEPWNVHGALPDGPES